MSDQNEDLELQALERKLEDAFQTTRPRPAFEDELWTRMQARRPFGSRIRDALIGLIQGIRDVPAVPLAGVAALLVVIIGIGLIGYVGHVDGGGGGAAGSSKPGQYSQANGEVEQGSFGRLPSPALASQPRGIATPAPASAAAAPTTGDYAGPVQVIWSGTGINLGMAPVFRYREPTTTAADQFASSLGAATRGRPSGYLGSYVATDYTLEIRGTTQNPPQSPAYFIYSSPAMPPIDAAGAGPADIANLFLAGHSLVPPWNYSAVIETSGNLKRVLLQRQFDAPSYGPAFLVDYNGQRYGMEVDLDGNRVVHVSGVLPVSLDSAMYNLVPSDAAFVAANTPGGAGPTVQLNQVELAYLLVPAGDHSYYEPVYVFSGSFQVNGTTYTKHLVVSAVTPSQRTP